MKCYVFAHVLRMDDGSESERLLGEFHAVFASPVSIGSAPECDVVLESPLIAPRHAEITARGNHRFVDYVARPWPPQRGRRSWPWAEAKPLTLHGRREGPRVGQGPVGVVVPPRHRIDGHWCDFPGFRVRVEELSLGWTIDHLRRRTTPTEDARWRAAVLKKRTEAAVSLSRLGRLARPAVPQLLFALLDADEGLRQAASNALRAAEVPQGAGLDREELVAALAAFASDDDADVREQAVWCLGDLGAESSPAEPTLRACLADQSARVRVRAATALWLVTGDAATSVSAIQRELAGVLKADAADRRAPDSLTPARMERTNVATLMADGLRRIGLEAAPAVPLLARMFRREHLHRSAVTETLLAAGPRGLQALAKLAQAKNEYVSRDAQTALHGQSAPS